MIYTMSADTKTRLSVLTISICLLCISSMSAGESKNSEVKRGEKVILVQVLNDGVTYIVQTSDGLEKWKDRDLHNFAASQETCTVISSHGSEVLLDVPIMGDQYWFTVEDTRLHEK